MSEHTPADEQTDNHEFNLYEQGDEDWSHAPDFETLEEAAPIRDEESERSEYTPHEDALFVATDTGAVYRGTGTEWDELGSLNGDGDVYSSTHDDVDVQIDESEGVIDFVTE